MIFLPYCKYGRKVINWVLIPTRGAVALRYSPSMWRIKNWLNIQQMVFTNNPVLAKIISIKTLSEEFKPIAFENYEFETRPNKTTNGTFCHVQPSNIRIWGTHSEVVPFKKHSEHDRIQISSFREGRVAISRCLNPTSTFAVSCQSVLCFEIYE